MAIQAKIWRLTPSSRAGINLYADSVEMLSDAHTGIKSGPAGVVAMGKSFSIATTSENIRTGGLWVMQNDFINTIPSTILTPIQQRLPFPMLGLVATVTKLVAPLARATLPA